MKSAKTLCNNLIKTNKKSYFQKVKQKGKSIININNKVGKAENRCNILLPTAEQINTIIKELNINKAAGPKKISPKTIILSENIIYSDLANIINHHLDNNSFSEGKKIATVCLIYKKE